jgi:hypothetical protein
MSLAVAGLVADGETAWRESVTWSASRRSPVGVGFSPSQATGAFSV